MKKIITILALILIGVYGVLTVLGSKGEYAAERLVHRAMKTHAKLASNPDVLPPMLFKSIENDLGRVIEKYPNSNAAKTANITLAEFYMGHKKYDNALAILNTALKKYSQDAAISSGAQFLKGLVYEKQGQWPGALREYTILRNKYPHTQAGLQISIYIGRYYDSKGMTADAQKEYSRAVVFYKRLADESKRTMLGYAASNFLAQAYTKLKRYEEAGKTVEDVVNNYPSETTYYQSLPAVEFIYVKQLNNPAKVIEIYKGMEAKTRNKRLKKFLQERIKILEKELTIEK